MSDLDKLLTLARGARGRIDAAQGAAIRDSIGRTYAAPNIALPDFTVSALNLALANAIAGGSTGIDMAVVVQDDPVVDITALRHVAGVGIPVHIYAPDGTPIAEIVS
jgi:hypothetical protein